jgi:hypothetical protein
MRARVPSYKHLYVDDPARDSTYRCDVRNRVSGSGRTGAWGAAHARAAESAQADFAIFQRRIPSLPRADGTIPFPSRARCGRAGARLAAGPAESPHPSRLANPREPLPGHGLTVYVPPAMFLPVDTRPSTLTEVTWRYATAFVV